MAPTIEISGLEWRENNTLCCHCHVGEKVFPTLKTTLGLVKQKNDGRWDWFVHPSQYAPKQWSATKHMQGVSLTIDDAKRKVESFLNTNN